MADSRRVKFVISIAMLIIGMTIGFLLLALAYTGPVWVKEVVILVVKASKRYIAVLKELENR